MRKAKVFLIPMVLALAAPMLAGCSTAKLSGEQLAMFNEQLDAGIRAVRQTGAEGFVVGYAELDKIVSWGTDIDGPLNATVIAVARVDPRNAVDDATAVAELDAQMAELRCLIEDARAAGVLPGGHDGRDTVDVMHSEDTTTDTRSAEGLPGESAIRFTGGWADAYAGNRAFGEKRQL
jgi:predicted small secreted protein